MVGNNFQDVILKYARAKIGEGKPVQFDATVSLVNTLCGDEITIYMCRSPGEPVSVRYGVKGCALCAASASIMSETLTGKSASEATVSVQTFLDCFPKGSVVTSDGAGVEALFDMRRFPARERCVLLPWQAVSECFA